MILRLLSPFNKFCSLGYLVLGIYSFSTSFTIPPLKSLKKFLAAAGGGWAAAAGCAPTDDGPVRQRAGFSRVGPEVAASCRSVSSLPSSLLPGPARPSAAAAAPGCPVLRARFTCTLSSRTFGKIRASFHSCFYVQPTSGRRDPASCTLFSIRFGS